MDERLQQFQSLQSVACTVLLLAIVATTRPCMQFMSRGSSAIVAEGKRTGAYDAADRRIRLLTFFFSPSTLRPTWR